MRLVAASSVAVLVAVAVVFGGWAGRGPAPASAGSTLLPDIGGRPSVVAVNVNSARRATLRNASLVTNLVNGLPPSTRFVVLTNDRSAFTVARNDRPDRIRFLDLPRESPFTIWTQDPFLVLTDAIGDVTLLTSRAFDRADDRMMAEAIAKDGGAPYRLRASGLSFEGGNIVSDREHVFIGANTVRANAFELKVSEAEVVLRFEEELGRSVLVMGPVPQPVGHIDMMITPLGNGRIALADPAAGARLAERALEEDPASVETFERWVEEYFFGDPTIREVRGVDGPIDVPQVRGRTREMIEWSWKVAAELDGVAKSLDGTRLSRRADSVSLRRTRRASCGRGPCTVHDGRLSDADLQQRARRRRPRRKVRLLAALRLAGHGSGGGAGLAGARFRHPADRRLDDQRDVRRCAPLRGEGARALKTHVTAGLNPNSTPR